MGRGTGGLLMASLAVWELLCPFFSFCDRNAATGTTTFQYILTHNHIPVDTAHRPQISPISFIFTLKPLMVRFHICVYIGVRHLFSSVYLCYRFTVQTECIFLVRLRQFYSRLTFFLQTLLCLRC